MAHANYFVTIQLTKLIQGRLENILKNNNKTFLTQFICKNKSSFIKVNETYGTVPTHIH